MKLITTMEDLELSALGAETSCLFRDYELASIELSLGHAGTCYVGDERQYVRFLRTLAQLPGHERVPVWIVDMIRDPVSCDDPAHLEARCETVRAALPVQLGLHADPILIFYGTSLGKMIHADLKSLVRVSVAPIRAPIVACDYQDVKDIPVYFAELGKKRLPSDVRCI